MTALPANCSAVPMVYVARDLFAIESGQSPSMSTVDRPYVCSVFLLTFRRNLPHLLYC